MVVAGLDVNGTGVLDEDEIEDTRYICDPEDVRPANVVKDRACRSHASRQQQPRANGSGSCP